MRYLAILLHYANSKKNCPEFYELKKSLLRKYATRIGSKTQKIVNKCWGTYGRKCDQSCYKCGGTGVYSTRHYLYDEYEFFKYKFLVWQMEIFNFNMKANIEGKVQHTDYGLKSYEAELWLYLLCGEFRLFWKSLTGYGYREETGYYPLITLQKFYNKTRNWWNEYKWRKMEVVSNFIDDDIPF